MPTDPARRTFVLSEAMDLLRRTPTMLDTWLRGLPDHWLHADEGPDTFSAFDVVGHLIYGERSDWIGRTRHIVEQREGAFEPFDRFGQRAEFADRSIADLLDLFASLRASNLDELRSLSLSEEQLDARGMHPAFGEVTLRQLLSTWVVHDQGHLAQIARVLAKRYTEGVGPWREYLPVLADRG